jgi:phage shock protein C
MTDQQRRLYRSQTNKMIAGVCGGLAEYLNIDTTIIRVIWVLITFLGGSGIVLYIIAFFIIPEKSIAADDTAHSIKPDFTAARIFGIVFVAIGVIILLDNLDILSFHRWWDMSWEFLLPGMLILAGIYFLTKHEKFPITQPEQVPPMEQAQQSQDQMPPPVSSTTEAKKPKVFRRSNKDKKILGICGGAGEYFDIDPTIVRIIYAILTVVSGGMAIILYFLMYLIVPEAQPQTNKQM